MAEPADREVERSRLAEDMAWLVHRWLLLCRPLEDLHESPAQPDDAARR